MMKVDIDQPMNEMLAQLESSRQTKLHSRDKFIVKEWARRIGITNGILIRKAEIANRANYVGVNYLTRLRTGTFHFTNNLVRLGHLPEELKNKCVCCKKTGT